MQISATSERSCNIMRKDVPLSPLNACSIHATPCPLYSAEVCAPTLLLPLHQFPLNHLLTMAVKVVKTKANLNWINQGKNTKVKG